MGIEPTYAAWEAERFAVYQKLSCKTALFPLKMIQQLMSQLQNFLSDIERS
jgi:hypothetical protein